MPESSTLETQRGLVGSRVRKKLKTIARPVIWIVTLFAGAGTLHWTRGWISVALYVVGMGSIGVYVNRRNTDVMQARTAWGRQGTKRFDRVFMAVFVPLVFVHPVLAGVDVVRYRWSSMPMWTVLVGAVLFAFSMVLIGWVLATNRHAESTVRIQTDRGHTVVTSGPYRFVRHPMYTGAIVMYVATSLVWGSVYALGLSAVIAALFIWRTAMEDRTLRNELAGYVEYARQTRFLLVPSLW